MGKRKTSNSELKSPKTEKSELSKKIKTEKRRADSSDSENEAIDEEEEYQQDMDNTVMDETRPENDEYHYEPDELRMLIESFVEFLSFRQASSTTVLNMERHVADWAETRPEDNIDASIFCADYRKYMKNSLRVRNLTLENSNSVVLAYLKSEKSLFDFKTMPARLPTKMQLLFQAKGLSMKRDKNAMEKYRVLAADETTCNEAEDARRSMALEYVPQLEKFLETHPNLTSEQKHAVEVKIKGIKKKYLPKEPKEPKESSAQKTPRKKNKKEPETAYTLFCRTKSDKYRDLSDEDREKKLLKKFAKLSPAELDLLESLALNS